MYPPSPILDIDVIYWDSKYIKEWKHRLPLNLSRVHPGLNPLLLVSLFYFSTGLSIVNMCVCVCPVSPYPTRAMLSIYRASWKHAFSRDFSAVSQGKPLHNYCSRWLRTKLLLWEQIYSPIPCRFLPPPRPPSVSLFKTGCLWTQICSPLPFKAYIMTTQHYFGFRGRFSTADPFLWLLNMF